MADMFDVLYTKCGAPRCKRNHDRHNCYNCGLYNSYHRKDDCTYPKDFNRGKSGRQPPYQPQAPIRRCNAVGCTELHSKHFCKNCKLWDSNHRMKDCPNEKDSNLGKTGCCPVCGEVNVIHIGNCPNWGGAK